MAHRSLSGAIAVLVTAIAVLAPAGLSVAQTQTKILRVGAVTVERSTAVYAVSAGSFLKGMAMLGYEDGRNFVFEQVPISENTAAEYDRAQREVAARKVDIFVSFGTERGLKSAVAVAGTKPIVMVAVNWDPLAGGYISSLARPGGNITGVTFREVELTTKRFQLLMEMLPGLKSATVFWDRDSADHWREARAVAAKLGLRIHGVAFEGPTPYDFERAFAQVAAEYRGGLITLGSPWFAYPERRSLPDFALRNRIPTMFVLRQYVDHGGLASYGPNYAKMFARAANYVDRIAKGAKPGDLPIELPTEFELVVNLKVARALGMTIPQSILLRAELLTE